MLRRELRVAFSKNAQPVWFRIAKWLVFLTGFGWLWQSRRDQFWYWLTGALLAGLAVHSVWRWQTHGWTRPWGGWNDVETASK
jgi:hypothetical protein